jgi:hypothetical protein
MSIRYPPPVMIESAARNARRRTPTSVPRWPEVIADFDPLTETAHDRKRFLVRSALQARPP